MKLYFLIGLVVIVLAALVLLTPNNVVNAGDVSTQISSNYSTLPVNIASSNSAVVNNNCDFVSHSIVLDGDHFSPAVMHANLGDKIRLTFNNGKLNTNNLEVSYDFNLPAFGISTVVDTAQQVEFTADKVGEFDYFCLTCSPQVKGVFVVN